MTCLPCQPWSCAELSLLTRPVCRHKRCQPKEMINQKRKLQVIELISFFLKLSYGIFYMSTRIASINIAAHPEQRLAEGPLLSQ